MKKKIRWSRVWITLLGLVLIISGISIGAAQISDNHAKAADDNDEKTVMVAKKEKSKKTAKKAQSSTTTASSNRAKAKVAVTSATSKVTKKEKAKQVAQKSAVSLAKKQAEIRSNLQAYLTKVGNSGQVAVSFYNLAPKAGSTAAKSANATIYQEGALQAAVNGDVPMIAASTYKLYITAYLYSRVATGTKTWTTADTTGFQSMIVNSANEYAESQLQLYGASRINTYLNQLGISNVFKVSGAATTTTNDLMTIIKRIKNAQAPFDQTELRATLLNDMGKQVHRSGIPAGASAAMAGTTVQDKVGWYGSTNNDAAIVTMPNGQCYLLTIMTTNSGYYDFSTVKEVTQQIETIVYGD